MKLKVLCVETNFYFKNFIENITVNFNFLIFYNSSSSGITGFFKVGQEDTDMSLLSNAISFKLVDPNDHLSSLFLNPRQCFSAYRMRQDDASIDAIWFSQVDGKFMQESTSTFSLNIFPKIF